MPLSYPRSCRGLFAPLKLMAAGAPSPRWSRAADSRHERRAARGGHGRRLLCELRPRRLRLGTSLEPAGGLLGHPPPCPFPSTGNNGAPTPSAPPPRSPRREAPRPERTDPTAGVGPRARLPGRPREHCGGSGGGAPPGGGWNPAARGTPHPRLGVRLREAGLRRGRRRYGRDARTPAAPRPAPRSPGGRARGLPGAAGGRPRERGARGGGGRAAEGRAALGWRCGAEQPPQNSASRRRPAPSTHFYICAPFRSSVTCPAPRPIGEALWSGQWKGPGQSARRLAWRQPMGTGLC